MHRPVVAAVLAAICAACGGVAEERVAALEAQLQALQKGGDANQEIVALREQITTVDTNLKAEVTKLQESSESIVRSLPPAGAAAAAHDDSWQLVDELCGVSAAGVTADGDSYKVSKKWLGRELDKLAAGPKPKLTANKKGGVSVLAVKPGSLPDKLGIKNGDTILSVGEAAVAAPADLAAALRKASGGVVVKLSRKNKELTLTYALEP